MLAAALAGGATARRIPGPGERFDATHRVLRVLAQDAMRVELLAEDEALERLVSIVILRSEQAAGGPRRRFEAQLPEATGVRHPNVLGVYSSGQWEGLPYLVREYVSGVPLDAWIQTRGGPPLPIEEAMGILSQLCAGTAAIHDAGLVHGGLAPSSVRIAPGSRVVIADFGLSGLGGSAARLGGGIATSAFLAPEAFCEEELPGALESRRDVYAIALMGLEMLTGSLPFEIGGIIRWMGRDGAIRPSGSMKGREVPMMALDALLLRGVAVDPRLRIWSVRALWASLKRTAWALARYGGPTRIVAVDDDAEFLTALARSLRSAFPGIDVCGIEDPSAALRSIETDPPALVIMDLNMPEMDGLKLMSTIRSMERCEKTRTMMITGSGGADRSAALDRLGVDAFLPKPFRPPQLISAVRRLLELEVRQPDPRERG